MKLYKIQRVDDTPVYKQTKKDVLAWIKRNPGEMLSYSQVDALEECQRLSDACDFTQTELDKERDSH